MYPTKKLIFFSGSVSYVAMYKFAIRFSGPTFSYRDQNDLDQKHQDLQSTVASKKVKATNI